MTTSGAEGTSGRRPYRPTVVAAADEVPAAEAAPLHDVRSYGRSRDRDPQAVRVMVPADPPVLTPAVARAVLRLLLRVAQRRDAGG
jgi:hypothetical protein